MAEIYRCRTCDEPGFHATSQDCLDALAAGIAEARRLAPTPRPTPRVAPLKIVASVPTCINCLAWRARALAAEAHAAELEECDGRRRFLLKADARQHWQTLERKRLAADAADRAARA